MNTNTNLKTTDADLSSQSNIVAQSGHVALVMGAFSTLFLIGVSFLLTIVHSVFS